MSDDVNQWDPDLLMSHPLKTTQCTTDKTVGGLLLGMNVQY